MKSLQQIWYTVKKQKVKNLPDDKKLKVKQQKSLIPPHEMALHAISLSLRAIISFRPSFQLSRLVSFDRRWKRAGYCFSAVVSTRPFSFFRPSIKLGRSVSFGRRFNSAVQFLSAVVSILPFSLFRPFLWLGRSVSFCCHCYLAAKYFSGPIFSESVIFPGVVSSGGLVSLCLPFDLANQYLNAVVLT